MKSILALILILAACLSLTACAAEPQSPEAFAETTVETTLPPEQIEITMDNWQEYFELREAQRITVNENGGIHNREFGYGAFLKEEYANRLAEFDVTFTMQADSVRYQVYGDVTTENYIIRKDTLHNEGIQLITAQVEDLRMDEKIGPDTDLYQSVAAYFTLSGEFGC